MEDTQHACVKERMFRVGRSPHHDIRVTVRVDTVLIAAHVVGVEVDAHGLVFVDVIMEDAHGANLLRGGLTGKALPRWSKIQGLVPAPLPAARLADLDTQSVTKLDHRVWHANA